MDQRQQSLLSESPSEQEVPDLELVPPVKQKKRLRRLRIPSKSSSDSSVTHAMSPQSISKSRICMYLLGFGLIIFLVIANIVLSHSIMETKRRLMLVETSLPEKFAAAIEKCEAAGGKTYEKVLADVVLRIHRVLNASLSNIPGDSPNKLLASLAKNITTFMAETNKTATKWDECDQRIAVLAGNVTELRQECESVISELSSASTGAGGGARPTGRP